MIFTLVLLICTKYTVAGKMCDNYEVVTTNPSSMSLQGESIGLYKNNDEKVCNGRPTFKHIFNDRYMYVQNNGTWVIGDTKGYSSCMNWAYFYHPDIPASQLPPRTAGWKYRDYIRNYWRDDGQLMVHCVCDLIQISSDNIIALKNQREIFGRYKMHNDHKCNNRSTYKHAENNRYLYVDGYDRWVISDENELYGKGKASPCTHWSFAYHPAQPSSHVPSKTGWMYNIRDTHNWLNDTTLNAICMCASYRVTSPNRLTVSGIKRNLLGLYKITDENCNKRPTYKHESEDLYLYVDNTDDWIISHGGDIFGKGARTASCDSMGYAYNPNSPAPDIPDITGWKYYDYNSRIWLYAQEMKVNCEN